jgi:hypothetical protein
MRFLILFLIFFLISCSKKEELPESNNSLSLEITNETTNGFSFEKQYNDVSVETIAVNHEALLLNFQKVPFLNDDIIIPNWDGYSSFDELYNHLGIPIDGHDIIKGMEQLFEDENNYAKDMDFKYYSISAIYIAQRERVYIGQFRTMYNEEIIFNYRINNNNSPDKVKEIFGEPYQTSYARFTEETTFIYFLGFDVPQINFSFVNEEITRIVFILRY